MAGLFAGVALTGTAMAGASAVATLIGAETVGDRWSGIPNAAAVLGTALGALTLGTIIGRRGHRFGLAAGYSVAAIGTMTALAGVLSDTFPLLLIGMIAMGTGNASAQLARYSAAELYPPSRKGFALSLIVWAGTIGAIAGPSLIAPTARLAQSLSMPEHAGPFLLATFAVTAAALASAAVPATRQREQAPVIRPWHPAARRVLRLPTVRVAVVAMVVAQLDMVAVMTMTPVHLHHHGHGLGTVGVVLTAHMLGMFALSPLSGRLADRAGGTTTILWGIATLVLAAVVTVFAPDDRSAVIAVALFLLGYGWNLVFVGGSSMLSRDLPAATRTQLQGMVDALVWGSSAIASVAAGLVLHGGGYVMLAIVSGALVAVPLALIVTGRRRTTVLPSR